MLETIDGRQFGWTETGAPRGQTLFLLHGFPFNAQQWKPQMQDAPAAWRVIAPDLPGFNESTTRNGDALTMDFFADRIAELARHLGITSAVFGGLSMGGYIVFALLRRHPKLVRALVLSDTRAGADTPEARIGRLRNAEKIEQTGTQAFIEDMLPKLLAPRTRRVAPAVETQLRAMMEAAPTPTVAGCLRGMAVRPDSSPMLERITVPTLIVCGVEDSITPPTEARFMARTIRGASLIEIEDAGHVSNLEQPDVFNRALNSFLTSLA